MQFGPQNISNILRGYAIMQREQLWMEFDGREITKIIRAFAILGLKI